MIKTSIEVVEFITKGETLTWLIAVKMWLVVAANNNKLSVITNSWTFKWQIVIYFAYLINLQVQFCGGGGGKVYVGWGVKSVVIEFPCVLISFQIYYANPKDPQPA